MTEKDMIIALVSLGYEIAWGEPPMAALIRRVGDVYQVETPRYAIGHHQDIAQAVEQFAELLIQCRKLL